MADAIYLRKSRVDLEAERHGAGDTLSRHKTALLSLAKARGLHIVKIYEEVVSGETITARPQMMQLLRDVEAGTYRNVLVMEVERLARGDTLDQGLVSRAFRYSGTKIVTPLKTYDPASEFDEEYFEFGLFMSRREYKTINRRQQAGRQASVNEGKWPANRAPYGYRRVKLQNEKGWTLEPDERAPIVRSIFEWYTEGLLMPDGSRKLLGCGLIVRRLNDMGIKTASGKPWVNYNVLTILRNEAYAGWVRWGHRGTEKHLQDGVLVTSRPIAKDYVKVKGLHPPLISQETFDIAQERLSHNPGRPGPKSYGVSNPLQGLIHCAQCGHMMVRRKLNRSDMILCHYTSCSTVGSYYSVVEDAVLEAMEQWYQQMSFAVRSQEAMPSNELVALQAALKRQQDTLTGIESQATRAYDLVEQGVYTTEVFLSRTQELAARREETEEKISALLLEIQQYETFDRQREQLLPQLRHVLDVYRSTDSAEEQNDLLKSVLDSVTYSKTKRLRDKDYASGALEITLHPRLPDVSSLSFTPNL